MEYYGDMPYSEELYHYGVKGMKWGVRKAIESGNRDRLARQAGKAAEKLRRLQLKANLINQSGEYRQLKDAAKVGLALAGTGAGLGAIAYGTGRLNYDTAGPIGAITGAGLGTAASAGVQALARRHRMSSKGHAKAVKDVRDWQRSMNEAFKGTRYNKLAGNRYPDKYALSRNVFDPKTGKVVRQTVATIRGQDLVRDRKGPVRIKMNKNLKPVNTKHKN